MRARPDLSALRLGPDVLALRPDVAEALRARRQEVQLARELGHGTTPEGSAVELPAGTVPTLSEGLE